MTKSKSHKSHLLWWHNCSSEQKQSIIWDLVCVLQGCCSSLLHCPCQAGDIVAGSWTINWTTGHEGLEVVSNGLRAAGRMAASGLVLMLVVGLTVLHLINSFHHRQEHKDSEFVPGTKMGEEEATCAEGQGCHSNLQPGAWAEQPCLLLQRKYPWDTITLCSRMGWTRQQICRKELEVLVDRLNLDLPVFLWFYEIKMCCRKDRIIMLGKFIIHVNWMIHEFVEARCVIMRGLLALGEASGYEV